ncbi:MAG: cytochrome c [bacterium]|nr:cytochrome c [bacterium]
MVGCQTAPLDGSSSANEVGDVADDTPLPVVGEPPTARANTSATGFVFPGDEVALSGSGDDPDRDEADAEPVLRWFQIAGSDVGLTGADTSEAVFIVPPAVVPGETLGFELRVTDADGNTTTDRVFLFVPRGPAVVLAIASGPDGPVGAGQEVSLSAFESLNIPAESAGYAWSQTDGPPVELSEADQVAASFVAPDPGGGELTLVFELQLTNLDETATDTVEVIVAPGAGEPDEPAEPDEPEPTGGDPTAGQAAYSEHTCAGCHGEVASGGSAPGLQGPDGRDALEERFGGDASHFGNTLTSEEIENVAAWLATLGDGAAGAGPCDVAGADAAEGEAVFATKPCTACHQPDASGSAAIGAPSLRGGDRTAKLEERFLPEGAVHNGATLTEEEVRDFACWFSTLEP